MSAMCAMLIETRWGSFMLRLWWMARNLQISSAWMQRPAAVQRSEFFTPGHPVEDDSTRQLAVLAYNNQPGSAYVKPPR